MSIDTNPPINRHEFNVAMKHLDDGLQQITSILQSLAVGAVENKARDEKLANLLTEVVSLRKRQDEVDRKLAWYAGAGAVVVAAWPLVAKHFGLT